MTKCGVIELKEKLDIYLCKKSPTGDPEADEIFMEFYNVQGPKELHWKILE